MWIANRVAEYFDKSQPETTAKSPVESDAGLNVILIVKDTDLGRERYWFSYYDGEEDLILRTFGILASNPELSFSWYDAACLAKRVRDEKRRVEREKGR